MVEYRITRITFISVAQTMQDVSNLTLHTTVRTNSEAIAILLIFNNN